MTFSIPISLIALWLVGLVGWGSYLVMSFQKEHQEGKVQLNLPPMSKRDKMVFAGGAAIMVLLVSSIWPVWVCTKLWGMLSRKDRDG